MKFIRLVGVVLTVFVVGNPQIAAAKMPATAGPGLFGSTEYITHGPPQWFVMLQRLRAERAIFEKCAVAAEACPSKAALSWLAELDRIRGLDPLARIDAINRAVNRRSYKSDAENFRVVDYWASPIQFLNGSGDCEDFVILKYFSLGLIGFPIERLRIVLVRDTLNQADHAVLAVYLNDEIYILDNNSKTVEPHSRLSQYVPLLSFDTTGSWGHIPRGPRYAGDG